MKTTYLGHSGFLVETEHACYIFDYIRGELTQTCLENRDKPVFVLVSHFHEDHFDPMIFNYRNQLNHPLYLLSKDTIKTIEKRRQNYQAYEESMTMAIGVDACLTFGDIQVETLKSTDEGVAFLITEPEGVIYHAGDLNWWDWPGEDDTWNRQMAGDFKHEINKLKGRHIDLAFVPVDSRQGDSYYLGLQYLLKHVAVDEVYPMHFGEDTSIIERYIKEHGQDKKMADTRIHITGRQSDSIFETSEEKTTDMLNEADKEAGHA